MISFIVDCFDPWEKVYDILKIIHASEIDDDYEVLLTSSLLLDTQQKTAEDLANKLFGEHFRFISNDSLSILDARCRAQELAKGEIFFFLTPYILPEKRGIKDLINTLKNNTNSLFVASALSFAYDNKSSQRILSHGFSVGLDNKLTPLLITFPTSEAVCVRDYPVFFAHPFCFCCYGAFYSRSDKGKNFLQRHIYACLRNNSNNIKGISSGKTYSCMYSESFPIYLKALYEATSIPINKIACDLEELALLANGEIEITPYLDFRVTNPSAIWPLPQKGATSESIFWGLLYWGRPEFIAAASHGRCTGHLKALAQISLWKIACTPWEHSQKYIHEQNILYRQNKKSQIYSDWLAQYESNKDLYIDITDSFKNVIKVNNFIIALKNCFFMIFAGLFGLKKLWKFYE